MQGQYPYNPYAAVAPKPKTEQAKEDPAPEKEKRDWVSITLNIILVVTIVALVVSLTANATSGGAPKIIAGYSASTVLTGSMEDTYPTGSLIVSKQVDPTTLKVGDDITFMTTPDTSVTHRIVDIAVDGAGLNDSDELAFITQGTMNPRPDADPVLASNIVGKVIFCSPALGAAITFLKSYWPLIVFLIALAFVTKAVLKRINKEEPTTQEGRQPRNIAPNGTLAPLTSEQATRVTYGRKGGIGAAYQNGVIQSGPQARRSCSPTQNQAQPHTRNAPGSRNIR